MMFGIAQFAANFLWGWLRGVFATVQTVAGKSVEVINYHQLFLIPLGLSLGTALFLAIFFHPAQIPTDTSTIPETADAALPVAAE